jgi:hypothetical protein
VPHVGQVQIYARHLRLERERKMSDYFWRTERGESWSRDANVVTRERDDSEQDPRKRRAYDRPESPDMSSGFSNRYNHTYGHGSA